MYGLLTLVLSAQLSATLPPDSVETLRARARRAEARFERVSRQLAPLSWGSGARSDCDEIVGRFCLWFDSTSRPPAVGEAGRIVDARREAVEAARRYFSAMPGDRRAAGPLVRLLVRDGRAPEAVSAAGAFAALSADSLWSDLLLGFAHHHAGADSVAERHFILALGRMPAAERRDWLAPRWLLDPDEHSRVRRLTPEARADYERTFWLLADPFWLTAANERWIEHIARHIQARLLAEVPVVAGMLSWGSDLDELTIRYGTPTARARLGGVAMPGVALVEYWDTTMRAFDPARSAMRIAGPPDPGVPPVLYSDRARSGYALHSAGRVLALTHQASRFLRSDSVFLRVDGVMQVDSVERGMRTALFVYDSAFTRRSHVSGTAPVANDSTRFTLVVPAPPGRVIYSAEMMGDSSRIAGRARYALEAPSPESRPVLSDVLIARRFNEHSVPDRFDDPRLDAFESLVLGAGDTVGIYAEVYRLTEGSTVAIDVALRPAEGPSILGRFARWLGRGIGLALSETGAPHTAWHADATRGRAVIALNLPLDAAGTGVHELVVRVTDRMTGAHAETVRRILIRR